MDINRFFQSRLEVFSLLNHTFFSVLDIWCGNWAMIYHSCLEEKGLRIASIFLITTKAKFPCGSMQSNFIVLKQSSDEMMKSIQICWILQETRIIHQFICGDMQPNTARAKWKVFCSTSLDKKDHLSLRNRSSMTWYYVWEQVKALLPTYAGYWRGAWQNFMLLHFDRINLK